MDAYHRWLGIPPKDQPPNHYRLLAIEPFESSPDVIEAAADQRMAHLRNYQSGRHSALSQKLLNEVAAAKVCLLNPKKKAEYDRQLRKQLEASQKVIPTAEPLEPGEPVESGLTRLFEKTVGGGTDIARAKLARTRRQTQIAAGAAVGVLGLIAAAALILWAARSPSEDKRLGLRPEGHKPPEASKQPGKTSADTVSKPPQPEVKPKPTEPKPPEPEPPKSKPPEVEKPKVAVDPPGAKPQAVPGAAPKPEKLPVPPEDQSDKVAAELGELFELSKQRTPAEQRALAGELLELAEKSAKPAERYVLLRTAADLLGQAGGAVDMLGAVDKLAAAFEVDPLAEKAAMLKTLAAGPKDSGQIAALVAASDKVIDAALAAQQYDLALELAEGAYAACSRPGGRKLRKQAFDRRKQVQALAASWQQFQSVLDKLKTDPDDPEANLAAGRHWCFDRGDWDKGLAHLAKSNDADLKRLAQEEVHSPPADPEAMIKLADAWWALSETRRDAERDALMLRAGTWYETAQPDATSTLLKAKLERRLEEINKLSRPIPGLAAQQATPGKPFPRGRWVDVLELVDPEGDRISGTWTRQDEAIATPVGKGGEFAIPVLVSGDYDLQWEFARTSNDYAVMCSFPVGPRRCRLALSLISGKVHGLELIDGQNADNNPTGVRPGTLINGQRYRVSLRVRTKGDEASIEAALEGKPLTRWSGKLTSLMAEDTRTIQVLGYSSLIVHAIRLRLVSGTASLVQQPPRFELQRTLEGHEGAVISVAFSPDGALVASAGHDNTVKLWKTDTWEVQRTLSGHTRPVLCLAFSPNGSLLASGGEDTTIQFWNVATGQVERTLKGHTGAVTSIAFSPDGKTLASTGAWDKTLRLWDAATGQQRQTIPSDERYMSAVAFSPKGSCLVAGHCGYPKVPVNYIRVWQLAALQEPRWSAEYVTNLAGFAFRPDGSVFAAVGLDRTVTIWGVATGKCVLRLEGHTDRLRCVAFSPGGLVLASGSQDQTVRLWTAAGEAGQVLRGHTGFVRSVAFSPDGSLLASASDDKTVKLWGMVKKD